METARLIGGAGTGKTTELMRVMERALPRLGNDPLRLGFASFTRRARAVAVSRAAAAWGIPPAMLERDGWFRTVHSTAMRVLGVTRQQLVGDSEKDAEWISAALGVKVTSSMDEDTGRQRFVGGEAGESLNAWGLARSTLLPLQEVVTRQRRANDDLPDYAAVVRYVERYEAQKRVDDRLDFTDLLSRFSGVRFCPQGGPSRVAPQGELPQVSAWLFDEQQDASPLLDACCKRLVSAPSVRWCYVVGDPFQAIFGFAGSSAACFLGWPAVKERTMPKSYRCPAPILELGERCLRRMGAGYFDRHIAPADHEGCVIESEMDGPISAARPDEDWLFIARTNYEARRMLGMLSAAGKPCRWVGQSATETVRSSGLRALLTLEQGKPVSGLEWARALSLLPTVAEGKVPVLTRGTKTGWARRHQSEWEVIFPENLTAVGATEQCAAMVGSGKWAKLIDKGEQWRTHAKRWGCNLASGSRILVGTVHSVKGEEADNVALLTTISNRVEQGSLDSLEQHDEECRIAYVGVTRAKRRLYVVNEGRHGKPVPRMEVL